METCFANLVEPGDKVVVCINGVFGMRMQENITRFGGVAVVSSTCNSQPPNEVTASTIVMQLLSCAILHNAFASERAPVEVSHDE
jgi:aspartate aminotransferase-like enzyme